MNDGPRSHPGYPKPLPPMINGYLARKRYVAAGLGVIDGACHVVSWLRRPTKSATNADVRSILVSQCGHLGDLIMTLPMLHWIRCNKPNVKIGLLVGSWAIPMMKGLSELYDACYVADHFMLDRSGRGLPEKIRHHRTTWKNAASEITRDGYDAAIECFPFLPNSIALLFACNIPRRVGFTSGGFGPLLTHRAEWIHGSRPVLDYNRDLLRLLFADDSLGKPLPAYYPAPAALNTFSQSPYVVIQTGTGNAIKEWPDDRWIQLVRELRLKGTTVILAGAGARERERAVRIREAVEGVVDLCDSLSWDEFTALVAHAAHVVCLDSSTSHLAAALQVPSSVIASGITDQGQYGPASEQARIFTFPTPCAPCFRSNGCEHMDCVRGVGVAELVRSLTARLAL